jgi:hypothetical protein
MDHDMDPARYEIEAMEQTRLGRFLEAPAHLYRQAAGAFGR